MMEEFESTRSVETDDELFNIIQKAMYDRKANVYYLHNGCNRSFYGDSVCDVGFELFENCYRDIMDMYSFNMALCFGSVEVVEFLCQRYGRYICFRQWRDEMITSPSGCKYGL